MKLNPYGGAFGAAALAALLSGCFGSSDDYNYPTAVPMVETLSANNNSLTKELQQKYGRNFADATYVAWLGSEIMPASKPYDIAAEATDGYSQNTLTELAMKGNYSAKRVSSLRLYKSPNSVVLGRQVTGGYFSDGTTTQTLARQEDLHVDTIKGTSFDAGQIGSLNNQTFNYRGTAFNAYGTGTLNYEINFGTRKGSGSIVSSQGNVDLKEGDIRNDIYHTNRDGTTIKMTGIAGVAEFNDPDVKDGAYKLGIFGSEATEIAGYITQDGVNTIGFGGVKQ